MSNDTTTNKPRFPLTFEAARNGVKATTPVQGRSLVFPHNKSAGQPAIGETWLCSVAFVPAGKGFLFVECHEKTEAPVTTPAATQPAQPKPHNGKGEKQGKRHNDGGKRTDGNGNKQGNGGKHGKDGDKPRRPYSTEPRHKPEPVVKPATAGDALSRAKVLLAPPAKSGALDGLRFMVGQTRAQTDAQAGELRTAMADLIGQHDAITTASRQPLELLRALPESASTMIGDLLNARAERDRIEAESKKLLADMGPYARLCKQRKALEKAGKPIPAELSDEAIANAKAPFEPRSEALKAARAVNKPQLKELEWKILWEISGLATQEEAEAEKTRHLAAAEAITSGALEQNRLREELAKLVNGYEARLRTLV